METHTGILVFGDAQVAMDDGTVLAVPGANPCATAAARFAKWGETQPVTVVGNTGTVDNSPVLFVTSIQWAAQAADAPVAATADVVAAPPTSPPVKRSKNAAASRHTRSRP